MSKHSELREKYQALYRASLRLLAAYDPDDPDETMLLLSELGLAAGCSSQSDAVAVLGVWQTPVKSGQDGYTFTHHVGTRRGRC